MIESIPPPDLKTITVVSIGVNRVKESIKFVFEISVQLIHWPKYPPLVKGVAFRRNDGGFLL